MPDQAVFEELRAEFNQALPSLARGEPDRTDLMTGRGLNPEWFADQPPHAAAIRAAILEVYGIAACELYARTREQVAVEARQMAAYVMRYSGRMAETKISAALKRDRSSIRHGYEKVSHLIGKKDEETVRNHRRVLRALNMRE